MHVRLGMDVVDIVDVEDSLAQFGARYLARMFTPAEIEACGGGANARKLAACLALKEATLKVLPVEDVGIEWRSIEVTHRRPGQTEIRLTGTPSALAWQAGIVRLAGSVSSTRDCATAVVFAEHEQELAGTRNQETWTSASGG